jgi:hypothetical protein
MTGEKPPELLMELDNVAGLWQIYIDVIVGLTRNPRWRTQSALPWNGCRVKAGMTTFIVGQARNDGRNVSSLHDNRR